MSNLPYEILLALAYVSQISDPDSVRSRFIESMNGLSDAFAFEFVDCLPTGVPEYRILSIATLRSFFGYAVMVEGPETTETERAVFRTAFQFLAVILENRMQAHALESRNKSLAKEIKQEKSLSADKDDFIIFSAKSKTGKKALWDAIENLVSKNTATIKQ